MEDKALAVVSKEVDSFVKTVQGMLVVTKEDYVSAVALRTAIKGVRARWVDYWADLKTKTYAAWKDVVAKEKEKTDILDQALKVVDQKALAWKQKEDQRIADEQRRLQAEADERARKERERLEKEAAKLKTPEKREERLEQAAAVVAPVVTLESATADVAGGGTRKTWQGEVVDMSLLIAAATPGTVAASLLEVNEKALRAFAVSTKGKVPVPGVLFKEVVGFSGRG